MLDLDAWHDPNEWRELLQRPDVPGMLAVIRRTTRTGRPLATDSFISKFERLIGKRLRPLPGGRPKKDQNPQKKNRKSSIGKRQSAENEVTVPGFVHFKRKSRHEAVFPNESEIVFDMGGNMVYNSRRAGERNPPACVAPRGILR